MSPVQSSATSLTPSLEEAREYQEWFELRGVQVMPESVEV
jgi:hypothetical protein